MRKVTVAAFGALNADSYAAFADALAHHAAQADVAVDLVAAGPYPNAAALSAPGRPLRGEALEDETKRQQLCEAVAGDARAAGALTADICCMPCLSMVGFHQDIERALGRPILSLAAALTAHYRGINRVGVLHMRPAKQRIIDIFGDRAVLPDAAAEERLRAAEQAAALEKSTLPVEKEMLAVAQQWQAAGLQHILFARADAPLAYRAVAGRLDDVTVDNYFDILARAAMAQAQSLAQSLSPDEQ